MSARVAVTDYHGLVDAMRALKAQIGLSNALVDDLCGWTEGQCDKLLGPSSTRLIGAKLLMDLIWVFGAELEIRPNIERMNEMAAHWERRAEGNVTKPNRISKRVIKSAEPHVMRKFGRIGGLVTAHKMGDAERSALGRKGARARWRKRRRPRNGSAQAVGL